MPEGGIRITSVGGPARRVEMTSEERFIAMAVKELHLTGDQARDLLNVANSERRGEMSFGYDQGINQALQDVLSVWREKAGDKTEVAQLTETEVREIMSEVRRREETPEGRFVGELVRNRGFTVADAETVLAVVRDVRGGSSPAYDQRYEQAVKDVLDKWQDVAPDAKSVAVLNNTQIHDILSGARPPAPLEERERLEEIAPPRRTAAYEITVDGVTHIVSLPSQLTPQNQQGQMSEAVRNPEVTVRTPSGEEVDRAQFALDYVRTYNEWRRDPSSHTIRITRIP